MKLISACLIGCECRYDKTSSYTEKVKEVMEEGQIIPICPEQLGGFPTPRKPAEIVGGDGFDVLDGKAKVIEEDGTEVTKAFIDGAHQALRIALIAGVQEAILKEKSPSCGRNFIYDGSFTNIKTKGIGVTAALFIRNGIKVKSQKEV